jgi:hypothetical protein
MGRRAFVRGFVVLDAVAAAGPAGGRDDNPASPRGPGPQHKQLQALVGKWDLAVSLGDGGKPAKGTAEYKAVLGGRFVMEEVRCDLFGRSFEWIGIYGYDAAKKKYTAVWVDNLDTTTEQGEGDAAGKVFTFAGEHDNPRVKGKTKFKWVIAVEAGDKLRVEMKEAGPDGKEAVQLTITATRAAR